MQCQQVLASDFTYVIKHCVQKVGAKCVQPEKCCVLKGWILSRAVPFQQFWTDVRWPRCFYNRVRLCRKFTIIYMPIDFTQTHISIRWILIEKQTKIGRIHTVCWWSKVREGSHLEDLGVGGRIILKYLLMKQSKVWIGLIWLRIRVSGILCEHGNENCGAVSCWIVFNWQKKSITFSILPYILVAPPSRHYNRGFLTVFGQFTQICHKEGIQLERTQQI